jgi:hypothetical protein
MTEKEVFEKVKALLNKAQIGLSIENPKVDFKREWYNLKDQDQISEFCKDVTAIANTVGLEGYIIIGYDEKNKSFHKSTIQNSGLTDIEINQLLIKHVDGEVYINIYDLIIAENHLSVISIPLQFNKPFIVRNYRQKNKDITHRIFVRKASGNSIANKYDLDFIYYDRKNVIPEIGFNIYIQNISFSYGGKPVLCSVSLAFENYGIKPICFDAVTIVIPFTESSFMLEITENAVERNSIKIKNNPLNIKGGEIRIYSSLQNYLYGDERINKLQERVNMLDKLTINLSSITGHFYTKVATKR